MSTFVLVHGACHRGSHWDPLRVELEQRGHAVVAPDLPSDDPTADLGDYAATVLEAVPSLAGDVVLVGHSLGGLTIPIVADQLCRDGRSPAGLVFLGAIISQPGASLADLAEIDADRDGPLGDGDIEMQENGTFRFSAAAARTLLYHDCPAEVADAAIAGLRPQRSMWTEVMAIDAWPDVPTTSIVCREDRIVNVDWSMRVSRERLGVEPLLIEGGHVPWLARPGELADLLDAPAS